MTDHPKHSNRPIPFPLTLVALAKDILLEPYNGPVCWYCSEPLPADVAQQWEDESTGAMYCSSRCVAMADADNAEDNR